jgi:hypothetical protein
MSEEEIVKDVEAKIQQREIDEAKFLAQVQADELAEAERLRLKWLVSDEAIESQPDLLDRLLKNEDVQEICLEYFKRNKREGIDIKNLMRYKNKKNVTI